MVVEERFFVGYQYVGRNFKITNSSLLKLFEDMACYHGVLAGEDIRISPTAWLLSAYKVDVKKRPVYNQRIKVRTWSRECRNFFACREFEIVDESGELLVCAITEWAHYNKLEGRLEKVRPELSDAYCSEPEKTNFGPFRIKRLHTSKEFAVSSKFTVPKIWIDTNDHMNNVYYLDLAEMMAEEVLSHQVSSDSFEIFYKQQIKRGETVLSHVFEDEDGVMVSVFSEDEKTLHAQISFKK